jgi:hypothetical protein
MTPLNVIFSITYYLELRQVKANITQPYTDNTKNRELEVLLELSSQKLYSQEEIQSITDNYYCKMKNPLCFLDIHIFLFNSIVTKLMSAAGHR